MYTEKVSLTLSPGELASRLNGSATGSDQPGICGVCSVDQNLENHVSLYTGTSALQIAELTRTAKFTALIVHESIDTGAIETSMRFIRVSNPAFALMQAIHLFHNEVRPKPGISTNADIHPSASIGEGVHIGAFCAIAENVEIRAGAVLYPHVTVYPGASIQEHSVIHSGATIRENCVIGSCSIIQNGAVIGAEGFGYVPGTSGLEGVPQVGNVILGSRTDIGANTCVDRATLGDTRIGEGVKIDNLVQIGHNVQIGSHSVICGQVGIGGSSKIGSQVTLGGGSGVADHVEIVDGCRIGGHGGVVSDLTEKGDYQGFPAVKAGTWRRERAALSRLVRRRRR